MFNIDVFQLGERGAAPLQPEAAGGQIHLAEDRIFYYRDQVYSNYAGEVPRVALAFQREVINNIIPRVRPQLIHCNDWMTGLIPGAARRRGSLPVHPAQHPHREDDAGRDRGLRVSMRPLSGESSSTSGRLTATRRAATTTASTSWRAAFSLPTLSIR